MVLFSRFMGPHQGPDKYQQVWLYDEISSRWADLLPDNTDMTRVDLGGIYSVLTKNNLRIININSMWGYSSNA